MLAVALLAACPVSAPADNSPQESTSAVIDVLPAELAAKPPGANWLSYNGDFSGRRYSPSNK